MLLLIVKQEDSYMPTVSADLKAVMQQVLLD